MFAVFALFRQEQELRDDPEAKDGRGHCRHPPPSVAFPGHSKWIPFFPPSTVTSENGMDGGQKQEVSIHGSKCPIQHVLRSIII